MFKKLICSILCASLLFSTTIAFADIVGHIYKTDIKAYENYIQIPSYNCGGTTVIFARDLENYGYDVLWNAEKERVDIKKKPDKKWTPMPPLPNDGEPVGKVLFDIYDTNIKTYFEGKLVTSYNIGGKTAITFRSIDAKNTIKFDNKKKTAMLFTKDISLSDKEKEHISYFYDILDIISTLEHDIEAGYEMAKNKSFNKTLMEKLNLSHLTLTEKMEEFKEYSEPSIFSKSSMEIWWAMVNIDMAANMIKSSWNIFTDEDMLVFQRYMTDFSAQRQKSLTLLSSEF